MFRQLSSNTEEELRSLMQKFDIEGDSLLEQNEIIIMILILSICKDQEYINVTDIHLG